MLLIFIPKLSFAQGFDEGGGSVGKSLGWISVGAGVLANVPFLAYARVKKYSIVKLGGGHEDTRAMALQHPTVLLFHMGMNLIGFAAGAAHGLIFIGRLEPYSLSLAVMMTVLTATGLLLKFAKAPSAKLVTRLVHSQVVLSGLLVVLVVLHIVTAHGGD